MSTSFKRELVRGERVVKAVTSCNKTLLPKNKISSDRSLGRPIGATSAVAYSLEIRMTNESVGPMMVSPRDPNKNQTRQPHDSLDH